MARSSASTAHCAWHRADGTVSADDIIALYERRALDWVGDRARQTAFIEKAWMDRFGIFVPRGGTVLDLGCGPGKPMAAYLLAQGFDVFGLDSSPTMVALARANFHGGQGDFHLDPFGRITGRRKPGRMAPFVYSGVQILSPRVIADWPEGPFSTMLFWERAIAAGRAYGLVHQGLWFDVGTPRAVKQVEAMLADG